MQVEVLAGLGANNRPRQHEEAINALSIYWASQQTRKAIEAPEDDLFVDVVVPEFPIEFIG